MSYHRTIKYLDYCESGERIKGGGVWKVEVRDGSISMEVVLRDVPCANKVQRDVILQTAGQEYFLGKIQVDNGSGTFSCQWDGVPVEEWEKMVIPLREDTFVVGIWQVQGQTPKEEDSEAPDSDLNQADFVDVDHISDKQEPGVAADRNRIAEEKWQHLWNIYPHIKPYGDHREFLSVRPADFLIFREESYKKVNNSFLLHGYYNYGHLILARVRRQAEYAYYVGTPGSFFEREKQVAIMFGFESFECEKEPAQAGDFGYYMMRVHL